MSTDDADAYRHANAGQYVITVDAGDTELELVNRLDAHTCDCIRRPACTWSVFDGAPRLLPTPLIPDNRLRVTYLGGPVC